MGTVLLQILPLGLIVIFLSDDRGLVQALAFILGKYLVHVLWGVVSLNLA